MNIYKCFLQMFGFVMLLSLANLAIADDVFGYLTDKNGKTNIKYNGPSLEDNVALMDTDKNGFADVYEVRVFLEKIHGKGYQKEVLDKMEASADGKSCSTPFAKEMYIDKSNIEKTATDKTSKVENPN
jgi:hypothetical protein